ncbi:E3 ubiquitin-protein ligase BRE1-like isoform X2 [Maniola jurtina]|uniref:E3 ubiquitin-protein ligase BRE1-like isoform X2 n=1 Tax=Maniola jurtina TaxID=191418 RepID=UPI001E688ACC|nr:E3 ubiquitin-protein ligase BRE1-like isoform X2 [Maniola jurtina]
MENKDSLDTNKAEIKKDRGDNLKRVVKPKAVLKKDLEIKHSVKDRGDSVPKPISEKLINTKSTKPSTLNKNLEKISDVTEGGNKLTSISKKLKLNEASKNFDETLVIKYKSPKQNETIGKSSDKSTPANLMIVRSSEIKDNVIFNTIKNKVISKIVNKTASRNIKQREDISKSSYKYMVTHKNSVTKPIKENVIHKSNENKIVHKTTKQNEELSKISHKYVPALITDKDSVSKPIQENTISKYDKYVEINKALHKSVLRNTKQDEKISKNFGKPALIKLVTTKDSVSKSFKDKVLPKNAKQNEGVKNNDFNNIALENTKPTVEINKDFEKSVPIRKNIVESEKHVNRLDIDEKKRIREKYTFKLKGFDRNKKLDDKNNAKDSQVEDKNDILTNPNNKTDIKEKVSENTKSESIKMDKVLDPTEKSRKRPIIRTIIAKNDATKVYKAVKFAEQKRKSKTVLQIKIPVITKNTNLPNDAGVGNKELPKFLPKSDENCKGDIIDPKNSQNDTSQLSRNIKIPTELVIRNTKVPTNTLSKTSKIPKIQNNAVMKITRKMRMSQSSESRSTVKTKISKTEKRKRLKNKLSHFSLVTGNGSPPTEVAKWAPSSINKHTQPYYEAWVATTLAAVSRNSKKNQQFYENQKLEKSFATLLQRDESPELMYENYLDERYTGKIKINSR